MTTRPDPRQFDLFADAGPLFAAAPTATQQPRNFVGLDFAGRPQVATRAWSHDGRITLYQPKAPEPFEVTVRGIPCVIAYSSGVCTHAIGEPGSPFWSETGFRSFLWPYTDPEEIVAAIERFIDAHARDGNGCGGKLKPWWPGCVHSLRQYRADTLRFQDTPDHDTWKIENAKRLAKAESEVRGSGLDPDVVAPWPRKNKALL